jgi:hypothetical protein
MEDGRVLLASVKVWVAIRVTVEFSDAMMLTALIVEAAAVWGVVMVGVVESAAARLALFAFRCLKMACHSSSVSLANSTLERLE